MKWFIERNKIMAFSNEIIKISNKLGVTITNLKLQKILSEVQVFYKRNSMDIFKDEPKIWRHGIVYPEVYSFYKAWFNDNIRYCDEEYSQLLNDEDLIIVQDIVVEYEDYDPWDMVRDNLKKIKEGYFDLI